MNSTKKIPRFVFGLILICFFLPFTTISCARQPIITLSGFQLVSGETITIPSSYYQPPQKQRIPGQPLASLALTSAVAGLGVSFLKNKRGIFAQTTAGTAGVFFLLLLKSKLDQDTLQNGRGIIFIDFQFGFWLSFLLFLITIGINAYLLVRPQRER